MSDVKQDKKEGTEYDVLSDWCDQEAMYTAVQQELLTRHSDQIKILEDQLAASYSNSRALVEDVEGALLDLKAEREKSAKVLKSANRLRNALEKTGLNWISKCCRQLEDAIAEYETST